MNGAEVDISNHPIFNPSTFYIDTPMIEDLHTVIMQWLWQGHTGGYVVGGARVGKSCAIKAATAKLTTRGNKPISVFYMSFHKRDRATIATVFRNLKRALGLKLLTREVADEMSDDIVHRFADAALSNELHYLVLVVDEVQRATIEQLLAFTELYDILVELGINLFIVFVANVGESDSLFELLKDSEHEQLRGRFFVNGHYFHGVRDRRELEDCLHAYDKKPKDREGPCVTEVFLPHQYQEGWRLHHLASPIWQVYSEEFQRPLQLECWGMKYFTGAIRTLLVDYLPAYNNITPREMEKIVRECILASGLKHSCVTAASSR